MSAVRYCVTMTQHRSHTFAAQGTHSKEQSWSVRSQRVWDAAPAFSVVPSHFPPSQATTGGSRRDLSNLFSRLGWGQSVSVLPWACWPWPAVFSEAQGQDAEVSCGSCGWAAPPAPRQCQPSLGRLCGPGTWQMGPRSQGLHRKDTRDQVSVRRQMSCTSVLTESSQCILSEISPERILWNGVVTVGTQMAGLS